MIRVVAGLIERKGRLLICQRRRGGVFPLQWEFPGGKLRAGETPRAGLARELREELGVTARIGAEVYRTRHRYREFSSSLQICFFAVREISRAPRNVVFERILWARPARFAQVRLSARGSGAGGEDCAEGIEASTIEQQIPRSARDDNRLTTRSRRDGAAAVYDENLAGDEGRLHEVHHGIGDVFGGTGALERRFADVVFGDFGGVVGK